METLRLPAARLGVILFVAYTGVEATFGAWTYTLLTIGRGIEPAIAGGIVSVFWGGLTVGRLIAAGVGGRLAPASILHGSLLAIVAGAIGVWLHAGAMLTLASIALAGLACGPIFPTLVAMTPARVGAAHVGNAVGFQIAAGAVGISAVPAIVGLLATAAGIETIASSLLALAVWLAVVYRLWHRTAPR
jgi:fucose permease